MKKDIKPAAVGESGAQTLETDIAASAAHHVQKGFAEEAYLQVVKRDWIQSWGFEPQF